MFPVLGFRDDDKPLTITVNLGDDTVNRPFVWKESEEAQLTNGPGEDVNAKEPSPKAEVNIGEAVKLEVSVAVR